MGNVSLLLIKRDGSRRAMCVNCRKTYAPGPRELRAIEEHGARHACICGSCVAAAWSYTKWLQRDELRGARMAGA